MLWSLFFIFSVISCLRIEFIPTDHLVRLSSKPDSELRDLIKKLFVSKRYWNILIAFSQARYYNFDFLFISTLQHLDCDLILRIFQSDSFPVADILSENVLAHPSLSSCFTQLPTHFFAKKLQKNPLETNLYLPSLWTPIQHIYFLKLAYESTSVNIDWYSWCLDPKLTSESVVSTWNAWNNWTWKLVSVYCLGSLPEAVSLNILSVLDPSAEFYSYIGTNSISESLSKNISQLFRSVTGKQPSEAETEFSVNQIMRIVTLSTCLLLYPNTHSLHTTARAILTEYLNALKACRTMFPMRRELKRFIRIILKIYMAPLVDILTELLVLAEFCRGYARGPWLMNVLFILKYYCGTINRLSDGFLEVFSSIFFDPITQATSSDTCMFLRTINSWSSHPKSDNSIAERIFDEYFPKLLTLARGVFQDCFSEIPRSRISNNSVFPLHFRMEQVFRYTRFIDNRIPFVMEPVLSERPLRLFISVCEQISKRIVEKEPVDLMDYTSVLPMNTRIISNNAIFKIHLPEIVRLFFQSIMFSASSNWFTRSLNKRRDLRPSLLPTLRFRPQLMEIVGLMLGKAVICNIKVPFIINRRYFELADALNSAHPIPQKISTTLNQLYPADPDNDADFQIYKAISDLESSIAQVLLSVNINESLNDSLNTTGSIRNHPHDMNRIVFVGSKRLRIGLQKALPIDFINSRQLYDLVFK